PSQERILRCGRAHAFWRSRRPWPSILHISMPEVPHEFRRGRSFRGLCCTHLNADGGGLVCHDHTAPDCQPLRVAAVCLASSSVRVCSLPDRSFVLGPARRTECAMTVAEIVQKSGKMSD